MKIPNILKTSLLSLTVYNLINLFPLNTQAEIGDPNGPNNQPQTGWTLWQPWNKLLDGDIFFGRSNLELGAEFDLQDLCFGEVNTPNAEKKREETYWWRLTNEVNQIGSGEIEYGCWINGQFKGKNIAIASKIGIVVPCLKVNTSVKNGLIIRESPNINSRRLGLVKSGQTVKGSSFPYIMETYGNLNWIEIELPRKGWILTGKKGINENVSLCKN